MEEIWKPIKDYEVLYKLSNFGKVVSLKKEWKTGQGSIQKKEETVQVPYNDDRGYPMVGLSKDGHKHTVKVHTLVWGHFGDCPRNGHELQVDHIDEDKENPRIDNLQLKSPRENTSKMHKHKQHTSDHTGVCWNKLRSKWACQIYVNGEHLFLGSFKEEIDATNEYQRALEEFNSTGKVTVNTPAMKRKSSKYKGVSRRGDKWEATFKGKYLGRYLEEIDASNAHVNVGGSI